MAQCRPNEQHTRRAVISSPRTLNFYLHVDMHTIPRPTIEPPPRHSAIQIELIGANPGEISSYYDMIWVPRVLSRDSIEAHGQFLEVSLFSDPLGRPFLLTCIPFTTLQDRYGDIDNLILGSIVMVSDETLARTSKKCRRVEP
jgi:hypothetical protein